MSLEKRFTNSAYDKILLGKEVNSECCNDKKAEIVAYDLLTGKTYFLCDCGKHYARVPKAAGVFEIRILKGEEVRRLY